MPRKVKESPESIALSRIVNELVRIYNEKQTDEPFVISYDAELLRQILEFADAVLDEQGIGNIVFTKKQSEVQHGE